MSLTSLLQNKDVKDRFKKEFNKPKFKIQTEMLVKPKTKNYSNIGTAFDYLMRFYLKRTYPQAIEKRWVAETSLAVFSFLPNSAKGKKLKKIVNNIFGTAKKDYEKYMKSGKITDSLIKSCLQLAQMDILYRAGLIDENLGKVSKKDVEDMRNLISLVEPSLFKPKRKLILNPTFGAASTLVGGADTDLVLDDMIIDIKTTINPYFLRTNFNQILGYYFLSLIGGIDSPKSKRHDIKRIGIYYSRYGVLQIIPVREAIGDCKMDVFLKWFKTRARKLQNGLQQSKR